MFALGKKELASFCGQLATMLEAGLTLRKALATLERTGRGARVKGLARRLGVTIEGGATLTEALQQCGQLFPPLMIHIVSVGEKTGALDGVLKRLRDYFEMMRTIQRNFLIRLIYPGIQYFLAILVLGILAWFLTGMKKEGAGGPSPEMALLRVWGLGYGAIAVLVALYYAITRGLGGRQFVHEILLHIPVVRYVTQSLALARFSWSMEMMNEAGMPVLEAIEQSLKATNNGAFLARAPRMIHAITQGNGITDALEGAGLFPVDYCEIVRVGEESGSLSSTFRRLAQQHFENSEAAMRAAATALGWLIWVCVAGFLIYHIVTLWMGHIGRINELTSGSFTR